MPELEQIPRKSHYRTSEVCQLTDTQPYVLRFWESEFPQLSPERGRGGQPVYRREDIDVVLRIKRLLYDEEYTIEGARRRLEQEMSGEVESSSRSALEPPGAALAEGPDPSQSARRPLIELAESASAGDGGSAEAESDSVSRERYDDALEEIAHLRLKIQEAEALLRKADTRAEKAERIADSHRERTHRALSRLEKLVDHLS